MEPKSLEIKTLDQLRALARTAGIRGYAGLRKKQLIELLVKPKASTGKRAAPEKKPKSPSTHAKTAKTRDVPSVRKGRGKNEPTVSVATDIEERIESAKFQVTLQASVKKASTPSLHEDIETLPPLGEPVLCLLPQKPGVVHAYWTLQPGASKKALRLRLCQMGKDVIEVFEEVDIRGSQGHWYFHVPEDAELGSVFGHLGYYDNTGQFVTAIERGIARIPTLYASERTDRSWWISDSDFRAMYERAGGVARGKQLRWRGSSSQSSRHK
jgi:hypothetical protein